MDIPKSTPKDVFFHLLSTVTLYVSVVSVIAILFQYVNALFPDELSYYASQSFDVIRKSVASLFVVWPVYIFLSWLLGKEMKKNQGLRDVKIRKWLVYLTLFVTAVTIIVDLITLVYKFLGGELSVPFILKVLAILVVAGVVFGYYIWDLKRDEHKPTSVPRLFAWTISVVLIGIIVGAFFVAGSPKKQRARRFDEQRIQDLQSIQQQTISFWQDKDRLPENLKELEDSISGYRAPQDPKTDSQYEYQVINDLTFELCAEFATEQKDLGRKKSYPEYGISFNWEHGAGHTCFERTIDPERYKLEEFEKFPRPVPFG